MSRWTLRRHLDELGIVKRQITQAKPEYKEIHDALRHGALSWQSKGDISVRSVGEQLILEERNGRSSAQRPGGHPIEMERFSRYFNATWLYRCNIYALDYKLSSMKYARHLYKKELKKQALLKPVENSQVQVSPQTPKERQMPGAEEVATAPGGENKGCKNENPQNQAVEPIPSIWAETKAKLLNLREKYKKARLAAAESHSLEPLQDYWRQLFNN